MAHTERNADQQGLIAWFASNPVAANLLMFTVIIAGLMSLSVIRKETFPASPASRVTVSVNYDTGATPEMAEEGIALKLEEAMEDVPGIKTVTSVSNVSGSTVTVEMDSGYDIDKLLLDIKSKVDSINTLPVEARKPIVTKVRRRSHVIWVQLFGDADQATLQQLANRLKNDLLQEPGISDVSAVGMAEPMMQIDIDRGRLMSYGLSVDDVERAVRAESSSSPTTSLRNPNGVLRLTTSQQAYTVEEFGRIPVITTSGGVIVRLADIANITDGFSDDQLVLSRYNGKPSVGLNVRLGDQGDITTVAAQAKGVVQRWIDNGELPNGIQLITWHDQSNFILERLGLLGGNAITGIIMVFAVLAIFLNLGVAIWVAAGLPFIFFGTLFFMTDSFLGITINEMSTFGFIMALGIVVDDAVVVGESVYHSRRRNGDSLSDTIRGVRLVAMPTLIGVLTTVVTFLSLSQVEGMMGRLYSQFGSVVAICLLLSVVESKLVLPAHLAHINTRPRTTSGWVGHWTRVQNAADRFIHWLSDKFYQRVIEFALRYRYPVVASFIILLIAVLSLPLTGVVRMGFFPSIQNDVITARLAMQSDASYGQTHTNLLRLEQAAWEADRALSGALGSKVYIESLQVSASGDLGGSLEVELTDDAPYTTNQFADKWREVSGFPEGTHQLRILSVMMPVENLRVELTAWSSDTAVSAGLELKKYLERLPGISGIDDNLGGGEPRLRFTLNNQGRALGLDTSDLSSQLLRSFAGAVTQRFQRSRDEVRVRLSVPKEQRQSYEDVLSSRIRTPSGQMVTLSSVVDVVAENSPKDITRIDGLRSVYINGVSDKSVVTPDALVRTLKEGIVADLERRYPGLNVKFAGEAEQREETSNSLQHIFVVTLLLIFALLAIPLKSYAQPLIIMTAIPFGLVGAVLGHWFHGLTISILSLNGVLALSGVVVNDSLLLVSRYNGLVSEGGETDKAIVEACTGRLRAILLTSATTFAGLAPLISETSLSAQFLVPAAAAMAYGILFATAITLVLIPCLLQILIDASRLLRRSTAFARSEIINE